MRPGDGPAPSTGYLVWHLSTRWRVALVPGRWTPLAGVLAGVFNLVASVAVDAMDRLVDPSPVAGFIGAWLMHIGLIAACIVGTIATARNARATDD